MPVSSAFKYHKARYLCCAMQLQQPKVSSPTAQCIQNVATGSGPKDQAAAPRLSSSQMHLPDSIQCHTEGQLHCPALEQSKPRSA